VDYQSVCRHNFERQHGLAHRAVADGISARRSGRSHTADRRVGPRIDWEEQTLIAKILVELLAAHSGFDGAVEIILVDGKNARHSREVERYPTPHR